MHLKIVWNRKIVKYDKYLVLRYMKDMKLLIFNQCCYTIKILLNVRLLIFKNINNSNRPTTYRHFSYTYLKAHSFVSSFVFLSTQTYILPSSLPFPFVISSFL